jgi:hypothetical protein
MHTIGIAVIASTILASVVTAADYLPLQEGNQWTYTMSTGMQMTTKVTGFADVGGVRCAVVEGEVGGQTSREYVAADAQGIKTYMGQMQGQEFRYDPPVPRIKLPYRQGDTWTATLNQYGMSVNAAFEATGTEQVQTPAGTFDCVKVRTTTATMPPMVSTTYYAAGVGPVCQVMQMSGQEITVTLTSTNVRPAPELPAATMGQAPAILRCPTCGATVEAGAKFCPNCGAKLAPPAPPAAPTQCPKCGAKLPAGAKFCPACGEKIEVVAAAGEPGQSVTSAGQPAMEKYESADGKVLLYKPRDWAVTEGQMFGPGIYAVSVVEPKEDAIVLFLTFQVDAAIKDSVALAARCIEALRSEFPDLKVANMNSTPERDRTIAEMSLTAEGEKGTGHSYFFHTQNIGTVFFLLAKAEKWDALRPTLTAIAANLAYAPQGAASVIQQSRQMAEQTPVASGTTLSPAAMIQQAAQRPGKQVPLQMTMLPDQSVTLQIPQGWNLEGQKAQFICVNNPQTRTHGMGFVAHTAMPAQFAVPGTINASYQPPARALSLVLEMGQTSREVEVLGECPAEQLSPEAAQANQQMRAQGYQIDSRLIYARFKNVPTGMMLRGLFTVQCTSMPMSSAWSVSVGGSWAPENEYDEWLPLYVRLEKTTQINQQWMGQEMQNRAFRQQQANRNLQRSIAESNQAFDDYLGSLQNASRSRDYTAQMWSQTTLGQGTWVAENEGARVYQTDSWGIQGPEGRIDSPAYNTTNFTGEDPWGGGNLEMVDTRAEYERYIANQ